jgi:glycosyltransferase involved in cell wall biosynthesis
VIELRAIHQFAPTLTSADSISGDVFQLQRLLWRSGLGAPVYADHAAPTVRSFARDWHDLAAQPTDRAPLLVHISMGNDSLDLVATLPQEKIVDYHNITPAHYFAGVNEDARRYSEIGRRQLADYAKYAALGIADSEYNRAELERLGYAKTAVVPILVDWSAFDAAPDAAVARRLADERTSILVVGQLLPQKALHDVIPAFARYREGDPTARLFLVGSDRMSGDYTAKLHADVAARGLQDSVVFAGTVSPAELVAYYRGASVLLTLSDHEGFCIPLLEAMRNDLPIVAHAATAIPDTLGDAGVLLEDKSPDAVATALERVVRDAALRKGLIEKGRARFGDFSEARVHQALDEAVRMVGWTIPAPRARKITVLSSDERCGIHHYSQAVVDGLRANGHEVRFAGVRHVNDRDVSRAVSTIPRDTDVVLIEHEAGIFRDVPFTLALLRLWLRRIPVVLSLHELEPEKFHHYRVLSRALHYRPRYAWPLEVLRMPWIALRLAWSFIRYRAVLAIMGSVPRRLVVHSDRSALWIDLLSRDRSKFDNIPLLDMPLEDVELPRDRAEKRALRKTLGLPEDAFIFVSPGFFFRRKRFIEVIEAAPPDTLVVLSGTEQNWDHGYLDEVKRYVAEKGKTNVIINNDYATMGQHVAAADCVVLYYEDIFQSAVAAQAMWAGLPCIFSDIPGFQLYRGAGLFAKDDVELRRAMDEMRDPATHERLRREVAVIREMLSPSRNAPRYLINVGR